MANSDQVAPAVFIVGTRAQLIKVAPVLVACEQRGHPAVLLLTGQHKETMEDLVLEFGIRSPQEKAVEVSERATVMSLVRWLPAVYFALVRRLRAIKVQSGAIDVIVHGDTLSAVIGALAGWRVGATVFHLESGLSSGRLFNPFPEELARRIVFRLTDVALCPGPDTAKYMRDHHRCRVVDTGANTIVDSVMMAARQKSDIAAQGRPYMVVSLHRFQNIFDSARFGFLVDLIRSLATKYRIHFVLHPATRKRLQSENLLDGLAKVENLNLSPRLGYRDFLALAAGSACVLTDGGSNQEELAVLGVPTIVMRQYTERSDGLGKNAVMEGELGEPVRDYLLRGGFESLRMPAQMADTLGPSVMIAGILASQADR